MASFQQRRRRPLALQLDFIIQSVVNLDEENLRGVKWGLFFGELVLKGAIGLILERSGASGYEGKDCRRG